MADRLTSVTQVLLGGLSSGVLIMAIIYHPHSLSPSVTSTCTIIFNEKEWLNPAVQKAPCLQFKCRPNSLPEVDSGSISALAGHSAEAETFEFDTSQQGQSTLILQQPEYDITGSPSDHSSSVICLISLLLSLNQCACNFAAFLHYPTPYSMRHPSPSLH